MARNRKPKALPINALERLRQEAALDVLRAQCAAEWEQDHGRAHQGEIDIATELTWRMAEQVAVQALKAAGERARNIKPGITKRRA